MQRKIYFLFPIIAIAVYFLAYEMMLANPNDQPSSFEEGYAEVGYTSVEEAVMQFENYFNQEVQLPTTTPAIPFTHQFGRFNKDQEYHINNVLEIKFVNEKATENHYKIDTRPLKNRLHFNNRRKQKTYTLKNGQQAIYFEQHLFNFFVFENDKWQYMLGIDQRVSDVSPDTFVEIANSIK